MLLDRRGYLRGENAPSHRAAPAGVRGRDGHARGVGRSWERQSDLQDRARVAQHRRFVAILNAPPLADRSRDSVIELKTRETQPFRSVDVTRDRAALVTSLRDDGYVDAKAEATAEFSDDRRTVAVSFHVTRDRGCASAGFSSSVSKRRSPWWCSASRLKEGDFLSFQKLLDTQSNLSATGLFSSVQVRELTNASDQRDLIIEVTEGPRTTVTPGLGYQKTESWRASGTHEAEFPVAADHVRHSPELGRGSQKASSPSPEPYAFGRRQTVRMQFYGEDDRSRGFRFSSARVGFQTETLFPVRWKHHAKYTFQKTLTRNVETDCAEIDRTLCDGKVSGPSLAFVHDTRNDPINSRRGTVYSMETLFPPRRSAATPL